MLESRLKELITVEGPQTDQLDLESSSGNLSLSSPESSSSTSQYIPNTKLIINNMNKLTSTRNQSPVDLLETLFSTGNSSSSSQFDLTTSFANSLNFTNVHQPSISPTSIGSTPEVIDLVDHLKFLDAANSTSDPYFSHLPQMGNIYQNTEVDYLNQAQKFDNIIFFPKGVLMMDLNCYFIVI
ncbi:hypothetical protein BC833DRAFT_443683 [Globomyces pollinis-pini]|nr:hypothetical protein BC833DRAFT_443683 [Globomyces pollinis-pini]